MSGGKLALGVVAALAAAGVAASRRRGSRSPADASAPLVVPVSLAVLEKIYLSWRDGSGGFEKDACVFRVAGVPVLRFGYMAQALEDHCMWCESMNLHVARRDREEHGELTPYEKEELSSMLHPALADAAAHFNALSFPIPVYRGLRQDGNDARGPEIRTQDAGKHWTSNRAIAQRFADGTHYSAAQTQGDRITSAVLEGVIETPGDVDWLNTLVGYLQYTWHEDEEHVEEQVVSQRVRSVKRIA